MEIKNVCMSGAQEIKKIFQISQLKHFQIIKSFSNHEIITVLQKITV